MKKYLILCFMVSCLITKAQEITQVVKDSLTKPSVEKSIYGVQFGLLDLSFQNEMRLNRKIALHSEIGFAIIFSSGKISATESKTSNLIIPFICLEPKWYYGIDRRSRLGRSIKNNSSNYLSLRTTFSSAATPITNPDNIKVVSAFFIIPEFGIRRNFSKHFNYEFSSGLGYQYNIIDDKTPCNCDRHNTGLDIQARIGYTF